MYTLFMFRLNTIESLTFILRDSVGALVTGALAADFKGGNLFLYKADNTKVSIALTLGTNFYEVDATDSPGLYSVVIPASSLSQLGTVTFSIQPAAAVFVSQVIEKTVSNISSKTDLIGTASVSSLADVTTASTSITTAVNAARDAIRGAQSLDISTIAGGVSFIPTDSLHNLKQTLMGFNTTLAAAVWEELLASHLTPNTLGELMNILLGILTHRVKVDSVSKQLILYRADSTTVWKTYNLYDLQSQPATLTATERQKAV